MTVAFCYRPLAEMNEKYLSRFSCIQYSKKQVCIVLRLSNQVIKR